MVLKKRLPNEKMMKGRCPICHLPFEFPERDKIDVILFGNWRQYHDCEKKPDMEKMS